MRCTFNDFAKHFLDVEYLKYESKNVTHLHDTLSEREQEQGRIDGIIITERSIGHNNQIKLPTI